MFRLARARSEFTFSRFHCRLVDFIADHLFDLDEDCIEQLKQVIDPTLPAIENSDRFNEMLPEHLQAIKLGDVETPVQAEIYAAPLRPDSLDVSA